MSIYQQTPLVVCTPGYSMGVKGGVVECLSTFPCSGSHPTHLWCNIIRCPKLPNEPLAGLAEVTCSKVYDLQLGACVRAGEEDVFGLQVPVGLWHDMT